MELNEHPLFPYPSDPLVRFGFIVGDIISWGIVFGIIFISLKATIHF